MLGPACLRGLLFGGLGRGNGLDDFLGDGPQIDALRGAHAEVFVEVLGVRTRMLKCGLGEHGADCRDGVLVDARLIDIAVFDQLVDALHETTAESLVQAVVLIEVGGSEFVMIPGIAVAALLPLQELPLGLGEGGLHGIDGLGQLGHFHRT